MASPQIENGFIKIANELANAFIKSMPGFTEGQIIWCILRKTYGWNKKSDKLSLSQLAQMTEKSKRMVIYAIGNLEAKNMITVKRSIVNGEKQINEIGLQKDYERWVVQEKSSCYHKLLEIRKKRYKDVVQENLSSAKNLTTVVQEYVKPLPKVAHTKDTNTKDNKNKDIYIGILTYLNEKAEKNFKPIETHFRFIEARLAEGATVKDFHRVIDLKVAQWKDKPEWDRFLRPETLFNATKFQSYLNEKEPESPIKRRIKEIIHGNPD